MISAVIASKNPWLLARMATDLQLHTGRDFDRKDRFPLAKIPAMFLHTWSLSSPEFDTDAIRYTYAKFFTLTASNYIDTLTEILAI